MARKDWLALVAVHSDAWLIAVAFYYGAKLEPKAKCVPRASALRLLSPPDSLLFLFGRTNFRSILKVRFLDPAGSRRRATPTPGLCSFQGRNGQHARRREFA